MSTTHLDTNTFLNLSGDIPILDVRTPAEFEEGHIPGAINFPLFSNEERAEIGTLYKQSGQREAVLRGLEFIGPRLTKFVEEADSIGSMNLRLHCWRGGMRSEYMAKLLSTVGYDISILLGGYKAYRGAQLELYQRKLPLVVLTGHTGSGKTRMLQMLQARGEQIIDLEALANHQGSSFGNQKSASQPTTEQFHNDLFEVMRDLDTSKPIWVEDESFSIGRVHLPSDFLNQKNSSRHLVIEIDKEERIDNLLEDYGDLEKSKLKTAVEGIQKKLGGDRFKFVLELIDENRGRAAASEILKYYDKRYALALKKKEDLIINRVQKEDLTDEEFVQKLVESIYVH